MPTLAKRAARPPAISRYVKILIAVVLSAVINLLIIALVAWAVPHWPHKHYKGQGAPITLSIVPSTPAPDQSALKSTGGAAPPPYIRTEDENESKDAPDQPAFTSHINTQAASEKPASGFDPLPTQDGKQIPSFDFDTRPFRVDKVASSAASAAAAASQPNATQPKQQQPPPKTKTAAQSTPKPQDQATPPPSTPTPDGDSAFLKAQDAPTPAPTAAATPQEFDDPPPPDPQTQQAAQQPMTAATSRTNSPGLQRRPGYQPESIQTRMNGSINNRGRASVAAMGTPMGRYNKLLSDAIGMRWYFSVQQRADFISVGSVKIHFAVTQSGKIEDLRIVSGKPNTELANISLDAIAEAEIPPIPPDVAATLDGNRLEVDYDFSEY